MIARLSKNMLRFFIILGLIAFISLSIFGLAHLSGMKMRGDGTMSGCVLDGQAEICPMTLAEHLDTWQRMFTIIPQKADFLIALFILISTVGALLFFSLKRRLLLLLFSSLSDRWRLYIRQNPNTPLFNHLREAFSQGILNPKIYDFTTL